MSALKDNSMILQKEMIAEHFLRLERAPETKDRRAAGITAPPDGLNLERYEIEGVD